jgi:hypothetical protein
MSETRTFAERLTDLADLLADHPEIGDPVEIQPHAIRFQFLSGYALSVEAVKERMAEVRRAFPIGRWVKNDPGSGGDYNRNYFELTGRWNGFTVELIAYRNDVCQRVVVGTEKVVEQVPTGFEEQTVEKEIVEWRCAPVLDATPAGSAVES